MSVFYHSTPAQRLWIIKPGSSGLGASLATRPSAGRPGTRGSPYKTTLCLALDIAPLPHSVLIFSGLLYTRAVQFRS